jgi:hypothetical protein
MMKTTSYIGMVVAAGAVALGVLGVVGVGIAADATRPTYNSYRLQHRGPNDNDHHANYHADYAANQDGRPAQGKTAVEKADPRQDSRRFQDGDRASRAPSGWRR